MGNGIYGSSADARIGKSNGFAITHNGNKIFISDRSSSSSVYSIKIYDWNGTTWTLDDTINMGDISLVSAYHSVQGMAINSNGTKLAVGLGYTTGFVLLYEYANGSWSSYRSSNFNGSNSVFTSPVLSTTGVQYAFGRDITITDDGTMVSFNNETWDASWVFAYDGTNWIESTSDAADMDTVVGSVTYSDPSGSSSSSSSSSTPICFLRGSKVVMGDGSERDVCDVREGDVLRT